jgi:hypothetical protein
MDALRAASEADFASGPWTGYYQQGGRRHEQHLELAFADGSVRGDGGDAIGAFVIRGSYDLASREVRWTKQYLGAHVVAYRGFREGRGIWGTWRIGALGEGFHVWPLGRAAVASAAERAAAPLPAEQSAPVTTGGSRPPRPK